MLMEWDAGKGDAQLGFLQLPPVRGTPKKETRGSFLTGNNEWFTPPVYIEAARATMGAIDLDPASNAFANETVKATRFYSLEDPGLNHEWHGRVWLNPPYGRGVMSAFIFKLVDEFKRGRTKAAVMVCHNYTDTKWFHAAAGACAAMCMTAGRIKFYNSDGVGESPPHGQVFMYFGENPSAFAKHFRQFGFVSVPHAGSEG